MRRNQSQSSLSTSEGPPEGDAFLACPICFEIFTSSGPQQPQQLDCSHNFCQSCITRWVEMGRLSGETQVTCPLCRQMTGELTRRTPPQSPSGSTESLQDGMRVVWLGPEGVAWVTPEYGSGRVGIFATRALKALLGGGLLIIAALIAAITVLALRENGNAHHSRHHGSNTFSSLVSTSLGQIRGSIEPMPQPVAGHSSVRVFRGVPFAEPPLRFRPAKKKEPWRGVRSATSFAPACMQSPAPMGLNVSEDCLYLNMWTPERGIKDENGRTRTHGPVMPVMVWIHGTAHRSPPVRRVYFDLKMVGAEGRRCFSLGVGVDGAGGCSRRCEAGAALGGYREGAKLPL